MQRDERAPSLAWVLENAGGLQHALAASADEDPLEELARRRPPPFVRDGSASRPRIGDPGSRRRRRHENSMLASEDSALSVTDLDSSDEAANEVGAPEWQGHFISAGPRFFEGRVDMARLERHQAREKRRRSRARMARRAQRLGDDRDDGGDDDDGVEEKETGGGNSTGDASCSPGEEVDDDQRRRRERSTGRGEYRRVRRRVRQALRELHSSEWLAHLERVVVAFQAGRPLPGTAPDGFPAHLVRVADAGAARPVLELRMADSFWRMVVHGVAQFHRLVSRSREASGGAGRVTEIRAPRHAAPPHGHRLGEVLRRLHAQRVRVALGRMGRPAGVVGRKASPQQQAAAEEVIEPGYISVTDLETDAECVAGAGFAAAAATSPVWELV